MDALKKFELIETECRIVVARDRGKWEILTKGYKSSGLRWISFGDLMHSMMTIVNNSVLWDYPGGPVAETPHFQCRGHGFNS